MKNRKLLVLVIVLIAAAAGLGWWWRHQALYPATDDAYVQAGLLTIAPQVGGRVADIAVSENQHVAAGDILLRLDTDSLRAEVEATQAQLDIALQAAGASGANVAAAASDLDAANATLDDAQTALDRAERLFRLHDVSQAALDDATSARNTARSRRDAATAALSAAQQTAGGEGDENAGVRAARAALDQATIRLGQATLTAPTAGWIANLSLRPGAVVAANQPLFSLVEDGDWWVDANFKETDLLRIQPGQPARLVLDMYPDTPLTGTVASIGLGSGASFALLPSQNASGNWVKVTQRFPVRIAIDPAEAARARLRVGASVSAQVDTSAATEAAK